MLSKMIDKAKWLYINEEGATMVEYALMLALIAVVSILIITSLGGHVKDQYTSVDNAVKPP
jgi:pilus assembly protein Flp/PilA